MTPPDQHSRGQRLWAFSAHASMVFILTSYTLFLGPLAAYLIYFFNRRGSPWVAVNGLQATFYQLLMITLVVVLGSPAVMGSGVVHPAALLVVLFGGLLYALIGASVCLLGREFRYPLLGGWAQAIVNRLGR